MIIANECEHCGGKIEFDAESLIETRRTSTQILGQTIDCPHCQKTLTLRRDLVRQSRPTDPRTAAAPAKIFARIRPCEDCAGLVSFRAHWCPHCGAALPGRPNIYQTVLMCALMVIALTGALLFFLSAVGAGIREAGR